MAEVAGLAFGTVALASLFSACVELIEYFELGRSFEYDYDLACLKLSLLKVRLDTCGKTLSIDDESQELRQNWSKEQDVIVRSLLGIKNILGNAELLKDKYRLVPHKPNPLSTLLAALAKSSTVADHSSSGSSRPLNSSRRLLLFRRSTIWAIRDRQKFDALLSDLEFFISNLEHVVSPLMMAKQPKEKERSPVDSDVDSEGYENMSDEDMTDEPPQKGQVGTAFGESNGHSKEEQEKSIANPRGGGHSWSKGGRDFKIKKTSGQATYVQGVQGKAKVTSTAPGQRDSLTVEDMKGQSFGMQGYNSRQSIRDVLKHRQAMIQARHSNKSNGSQNASQSNNFSGAGRCLGE
jgi:Prion-inhibition and propagation